MQLTEKNRKYILVGIVVFVFVGIFTAKILGSKQDEQFKYEDMLFLQASEMYREGNYANALVSINELLKTKSDSEIVNYLGAEIAAQMGEYQQSAILFHRTLDLNPHHMEDAGFILRFGEILFLAERYEDAKVILEHARAKAWTSDSILDYQERVTNMLKEIENM